MRLDDIRFHKDWTISSNFRRQIEILEISEEWEEDLKTEHDFRMDSLLRRHFRYHWLAFSRHLLERSGNDVRTLHIMGRMCSAEMIERLLNSGDKIEFVSKFAATHRFCVGGFLIYGVPLCSNDVSFLFSHVNAA